jgi:outer membrane protein
MAKAFSCILILLVLFFPPKALGAAAPEPKPEALTLGQCLDMAYQNSQQLKISAENVVLVKETVREAGSKFWPVGAYEYGYQDASQGELWFINPSTMEWVRKPDKGYGAALTLTQPLYTGGKLTGNLAIAKLQLATAIENQRKTKQQLTFNVKEGYYGVWLAEQMLKVAESSYQNMELHVQQVQNQRRVGTSSKFDLLQAQVQRDRLKPLVIKTQNQLALAKSNLALLTGMNKNRHFTVTNDLTQLSIPEKIDWPFETIVAESYQKRPEMCQIKHLARISQEQLKIAKAGYKPELALSAKYKAEGEEASVADEKTWILSVGLSGIFFDGFGTQARVNQAKTGIKITQAKAADLSDQISLEIEQSLQNLGESLETIHANQANIDLAKESLRMTQIRFEAGLATTMDVMDAQLALDQASNGYYEGIYQYLTGNAQLDLVIGR